LNSKAITKMQTIIFVSLVIVASVAGVVYVFWSDEPQQSQTIKIGICSDLGSRVGDATWRGAVLAAEQINAEGGILGRQIELVSEDTDMSFSMGELNKVSAALTRLITYHKVDFVIGGVAREDNMGMQDIVSEHKKIFISVSAGDDVLTERVLNDYEKYKYFFKVSPPNSTSLNEGYRDSLVALREYTGFNKIAYLAVDLNNFDDAVARIESLPELHGFELVYGNRFPPGTFDFSSYFAAAEAAGAEILVPLIAGEEGIAFTKEWYDRQSPFVLWGTNALSALPNYWEITEGKCEHETSAVPAAMAGYPISSKTLATINAYLEMWGEPPIYLATGAYDIIRFILPDALERAGTLETEAVIKALEEVDVETTTAPRFIFLDSHDILYGPGYDEQYFFQWQANGTRVPIYPRELKEGAGAIYTFPDWLGPWD